MSSYLIAEKANTDIINADGYLPVHLAAKYGNFTCLTALIQSMSDINIVTKEDENSLLHLACNGGEIT